MKKAFNILLFLLISFVGLAQGIRHDQLRTPVAEDSDSVIYMIRDGAYWRFGIGLAVTPQVLSDSMDVLRGEAGYMAGFLIAKVDTNTYVLTKTQAAGLYEPLGIDTLDVDGLLQYIQDHSIDVEYDPFYALDSAYLNDGVSDWLESIAYGITDIDTAYWNDKLDSYTEIDPKYAIDSANIVWFVDLTGIRDSLSNAFDSLAAIYTETQVNTLLAGKADTASVNSILDSLENIYTESQVNTLLAGKADTTITNSILDSLAYYALTTVVNDSLGDHDTRILDNYNSIQSILDSLGNIYNESQIDAFLGAKADTASVNSILDSLANIYTEAQVDLLLGAKADTTLFNSILDSLENIYTESQVNALLAAKTDTTITNVLADSTASYHNRLLVVEGLDTTGIFHANRALLDAIDATDTTRWGTQPQYLTDLDSTGFTVDTSQVRNLTLFVQNNSTQEEVDPVFTTSVAYSINAADTTRWASQKADVLDTIANLTMDDLNDGVVFVRTENNFSDSDASKLAGIQAGAEVNVQTDVHQTNNEADNYLIGRDSLAFKSDTTVYLQSIYRTDSLVTVLYDSISARLDSTASIARFDIDSIWTSRGQTFISQGGVIDSTGQERVSVGDFYGGGYVFYVSPDGTWGISAASSKIATATWEVLPVALKGASGTSIGTGNANTELIVAAEGAGTYAAKLCYDLSLGGFTDWYLPSIDELDSIYEVLYVDRSITFGLSASPDAYYAWSSTEFSSNAANTILFTSGSISGFSKTGGNLAVIAARTWFIEGESTLPAGDAGDMLYNTGGAWTTLPIGSDNQILKVNGTVPNWEADAGGGTVTNFSAGDLSPLFTTTETNTTTTPALSFSQVAQTQNKVFASPNGSTGNPTFRALVGADFPASGVSAGSYTNTNITVDAYGRVTSAANGSAAGYTLPVASPSELGGFQVYANTAGYYMSGNYLLISSEKYNTGTPTTDSYIALWNGATMIKSTVSDILGLGSGAITVRESDGSPSYSGITTVELSGGVVSNPSAGVARLTVTGGGGATNLSYTRNATTVTVASDTGDDATLPAATTSLAGIQTAADKTKLDAAATITGTESLTNKTVNGVVLTDAEDGSGYLSDDGNYKTFNPQSITTTADLTNGGNFKTTASSNKTITFINDYDGASGQVEVAYSSAAKITFARSGFTIKIASNIYDSAATVLSKSSGTAIYSYYISNSIIYVNGTQSYQ